MKDITDRKDIEKLVDAFYAKAVHDELIGHFFTKVAPIKLDKHMPIMYRFWEGVLFGSASYQGNPMLKHLDINRKSALGKKHFERWFTLWESEVDELFQGVKAEEAKSKARQIGGLMQFKIDQISNS